MDREPAPKMQNQEPAGLPKKRPYIKPGFEFERAFETMALSCGKIQTGSKCQHSKKSS